MRDFRGRLPDSTPSPLPRPLPAPVQEASPRWPRVPASPPPFGRPSGPGADRRGDVDGRGGRVQAVRRRRRGRSAGVVGGHAASCGRRRPGPGRRLGRGHRGRRAAVGRVSRTRPPRPPGRPLRRPPEGRAVATPRRAAAAGRGRPRPRGRRAVGRRRPGAALSGLPPPHAHRPRPPGLRCRAPAAGHGHASTSRWSAWVPAWRRWSPWPVSAAPRSPSGCRSRSVGRGRGSSTADGTGIPSARTTTSANQGSSGRPREAPGIPDNRLAGLQRLVLGAGEQVRDQFHDRDRPAPDRDGQPAADLVREQPLPPSAGQTRHHERTPVRISSGTSPAPATRAGRRGCR